MKKAGIYVHVPFCEQKCPYCDFYSLPFDDTIQEKYTDAIIASMNIYCDKNIIADTLYFGGGTPSLLRSDLLAKIINHSNNIFGDFTEITVEANPNSTTLTWLEQIVFAGVNRISFGMQSACENELKVLKRRHNFADVQHAVSLAKGCGITNISVDMMLGIPHQSLESVNYTLDKINSLDITHVSAYMLKIEENTPFNCESILATIPDDDAVSDIYLHVCDKLSLMGFEQYEISNFAKDGLVSKHNMKYWLGNDYLGFGSSAHSYYNSDRFFFPDDLSSFIGGGNIHPIADETVSMSALEEYIIFHLRLASGISVNYLNQIFSVNVDNLLHKVSGYIDMGLIKFQDNNLFFTPSGFLLSNELIFNVLNFCEEN